MIKKGRTRHFIIWIILALILPAILLVGVLNRHEDPVNETVPTVQRSFETNE